MKKLLSLFITLCILTSLFTVSANAYNKEDEIYYYSEDGTNDVTWGEYAKCRDNDVFVDYLTELGVQNQVGIPALRGTNFNYDLDKNDPYYKRLVNLTNDVVKDCSTDAEKVEAIVKFVYDQLVNRDTHDYSDYEPDEHGNIHYKYTCNHKDKYGNITHDDGSIERIYELAGLCTERPVSSLCAGCSYLTGYMLYLIGIPNMYAMDIKHQYNLAYYDNGGTSGKKAWHIADGFQPHAEGADPDTYPKCTDYGFYMDGFAFEFYTDLGCKVLGVPTDISEYGFINVVNYVEDDLKNKEELIIPDFVYDINTTAYFNEEGAGWYTFAARMNDGSKLLIKSKDVAQRFYEEITRKVGGEGNKAIKSPKTYTKDIVFKNKNYFNDFDYDHVNALTRVCKPYFDGEYWVVRRHNLEFIDGIEMDCTHDATYRGYHCTLCDEYVTDQYVTYEITYPYPDFPLVELKTEHRENIVLNKADGLSHNYGDWVTTKEATCSEKGIAEKTCSTCGNKITKDLSPNHNHNLSYLPSGADNWTITRWHCSICNKDWNANVYTKNKILSEDCISLLNNDTYFSNTNDNENGDCEHNYQLLKDKSKEATCTENGYAFYECTKCQNKKEEIIEATNHTFEKYSYNNDATCGKDGTETAQCENCNEKDIRVAKGTALKHKFSNYTTNKEADCIHNRIEIAHCDSPGCTATDEREVPNTALGHNIVTSKGTPATCASHGKTGDITCSRCKKVFSKGQDIPPTNAHKLVYHEANEATCNNKGNIAHLQCSICNKTFSLNGSPFSGTITIEKLPHNIKLKNATNATYFTTGYTGDKICSVCGIVTNKGSTINKLKLKTPKCSFKGNKKKLTVSYTSVTNATGFQVKYTFNGKTKTKTYNTLKSVKKTIKNLKKGKYKVQIRAFIKQDNKTAYSNWTKSKTVKVK